MSDFNTCAILRNLGIRPGDASRTRSLSDRLDFTAQFGLKRAVGRARRSRRPKPANAKDEQRIDRLCWSISFRSPQRPLALAQSSEHGETRHVSTHVPRCTRKTRRSRSRVVRGTPSYRVRHALACRLCSTPKSRVRCPPRGASGHRAMQKRVYEAEASVEGKTRHRSFRRQQDARSAVQTRARFDPSPVGCSPLPRTAPPKAAPPHDVARDHQPNLPKPDAT